MPKDAPTAPEKVTAAHIRRGLTKMFPHPECGIVFEVAQSTGFAAHRHLDAIAMDTWPSRGLIISGIEIKVDIYDWRREKANPAKAEQLARFCDKFFIAAPPGLIPVAELPDAWGLLEGGQNGMRITKPALKTKAEPVTREFLAAVFRASGRSMVADDVELALANERERLQAGHAEKVRDEAERLSTGNSQDAKNWRALMTALGVDALGFSRFVSQHDAQEWIAVIKAVHAGGVHENYHGLLGMREAVRAFHQRIDEAAAVLGAPVDSAAMDALKGISRKRRGNRA